MKNTLNTTSEAFTSGLEPTPYQPFMTIRDYYNYKPDPRDNLLGNEFLCRKGILIIAGPSHVGKSSLSVQQDVLWSLGRPALGITPARPLRILTFQAENDANAMHLAARGVIDKLTLSATEFDQVASSTACISLRSCSGADFLQALDTELEARAGWADLIRLDPLMAFIGDDPANTKAVQEFMRRGLNALLERHNIGAICTHHTTKTQYIDTEKFNPHDFQYCMAGTADLTNLARSVISINPCKDGKTFAFIAAKGKAKIGWATPTRYFAHASAGIFWEDAAAPVTPPRTIPRSTATAEKLLALFGDDSELKKEDLLARCTIAEIGQNIARTIIAKLTSQNDGRLSEFEKPRKGSRPEVWVKLTGAKPQPPQPGKDEDYFRRYIETGEIPF